jgi:hypothetical protein
MYQVSHTQHQFLSIYSRLRVSAVIASHHQAFYINVDTGDIIYCVRRRYPLLR